jgi:hypothetical protein
MKSKLLSIKTKTKAKAICSLVVMLVTLALAIPAQAQLDNGPHDIFQTDDFGNQVKVGEIYVPQRAPGATSYVEHWVLFENYTYHNAENRVITIIRPSQRTTRSEEEFLAGIPNRPGVRYVRVDCTETLMLPRR